MVGGGENRNLRRYSDPHQPDGKLFSSPGRREAVRQEAKEASGFFQRVCGGVLFPCYFHPSAPAGAAGPLQAADSGADGGDSLSPCQPAAEPAGVSGVFRCEFFVCRVYAGCVAHRLAAGNDIFRRGSVFSHHADGADPFGFGRLFFDRAVGAGASENRAAPPGVPGADPHRSKGALPARDVGHRERPERRGDRAPGGGVQPPGAGARRPAGTYAPAGCRFLRAEPGTRSTFEGQGLSHGSLPFFGKARGDTGFFPGRFSDVPGGAVGAGGAHAFGGGGGAALLRGISGDLQPGPRHGRMRRGVNTLSKGETK